MRLDASLTESFVTQGVLYDFEATTAGTKMWKYFGRTEKVNDANQLNLKLVSDFELNPQSMLYNLIVGKYKVLTPFSKRHTELEFFWDKKNKNALLNQFYAKAKVEKDTITVADVLISTAIVPYKVHVFLPAVLGKLRQGWTQIDIDVAHTPGTSLEMKVNHPGAQFTGFKIAKTGYGNEREVEWNGEKLGKGSYVMSRSGTRKTMKLTTTLRNGKTLTTTIGWKVTTPLIANPVNDGSKFVRLNNRLEVVTPEDAEFGLALAGQCSGCEWGNWQINRIVKINSAARQISLDLTGDSNFPSGALATHSPIETEA